MSIVHSMVFSMSEAIDYEKRLEIYEKFYWILNDCIVKIRDAINRLYTAEYEEAVGIINDVVSTLNNVSSDVSSIASKYAKLKEEKEEKIAKGVVKLEEIKFHEEEKEKAEEKEQSEEHKEETAEATAQTTTETTKRKVKRKQQQTQ